MWKALLIRLIEEAVKAILDKELSKDKPDDKQLGVK